MAARAAALALALLAARADYVLQQQFLAASCPPGGAFAAVATYGDVGFAPASATTAGCVPAAGAPGLWAKTVCADASSGALNYYSNSFCQGTTVTSQQLSAVGFAAGCTAAGSGSQSFTCTAGAFAPGSSALTRAYAAPATCANASLYAPTQVAAVPLGACVQQSGGPLPQYSLTTCNGTAVTTSLFLEAACSGAPAATTVALLACTDSPSGPSVVSCSAAAGASATPLPPMPSASPAASSAAGATATATTTATAAAGDAMAG